MPSNSAAEFDPCEISQRIYRVKTLRQSGSEILKFSPHLRRKILQPPAPQTNRNIAIFKPPPTLAIAPRAVCKKTPSSHAFHSSLKSRYRLRNLSSRKIASLKPPYFAIKSDFTLASRGNFAPLCRFRRDSALPPPSASATSAKSYNPQ